MSFFWLGPALQAPPRRVVSLVPSLTEALAMLGGLPRLVGRSSYCTSPPDVVAVADVGGTKTFRPEAVLRLAPELVLAAKEENPKRLVQALAASVPVLVADPPGPEAVPALWRELGRSLGAAAAGEALAQEVERELAACRALNVPSCKLGFVYFVWAEPWMAAGPETYASRLLEACGFANAVPGGPRRYPVVGRDCALAPEVALHLYPDEPYPFALPRALAPWGLAVTPLPALGEGLSGAAPAPEAASAKPQQADPREPAEPPAPRGQAPDLAAAYRLDGRILCLAANGATFTWYPSRTARGLRAARRLATFFAAKPLSGSQ